MADRLISADSGTLFVARGRNLQGVRLSHHIRNMTGKGEKRKQDASSDKAAKKAKFFSTVSRVGTDFDAASVNQEQL